MFPAKLTIGLVGSLVLAVVTAVAELYAQATDGTDVGTFASAGALTTTAGALVWVIGLLASGRLVHRDPAKANKALEDQLAKVTDALDQAAKREDTFRELAFKKGPPSHGRTSDHS